ncbi:MAG: sugar phosphate isomerase/epimerase [Caldilineaceae bacterium]
MAATLDFIAQVGEPNLHLLLDVGHAQMTNEPIPAAIRRAGDRLCYVHLDDNDGVGDLHWALLDGVMTEQSLADTFKTLREIDYPGAISLEISPHSTIRWMASNGAGQSHKELSLCVIDKY